MRSQHNKTKAVALQKCIEGAKPPDTYADEAKELERIVEASDHMSGIGDFIYDSNLAVGNIRLNFIESLI